MNVKLLTAAVMAATLIAGCNSSSSSSHGAIPDATPEQCEDGSSNCEDNGGDSGDQQPGEGDNNGDGNTDNGGEEGGDNNTEEPELPDVDGGTEEQVSAKSFIFATGNSPLAMELWYSNGTKETTVMLGEYSGIANDIALTSKAARLSDTHWIFALGNFDQKVFTTEGNFGELQELDSAITEADEFVNVGNTVFFKAKTNDIGKELAWVTVDEEGDLQLQYADIRTGSGDSMAKSPYITAFKDKAYFRADDGENGMEIFVSNGTQEGTKILYHTNPTCRSNESSPSDINEIRVAGDKLYFTASYRVCEEPQNVVIETLWVYDGVEDPAPVNKVIEEGNKPNNFMSFDGKLFFTLGADLWVSDGSELGTQQVANAACASACNLIITEASDKSGLFFSESNKYHLVIKDDDSASGYKLEPISYSGSAVTKPLNVNGVIYARQGNENIAWVDTSNAKIEQINGLSVVPVAEDGVAVYGLENKYVGIVDNKLVYSYTLHKAQVDKDGNIAKKVVKELD